MHPGIAPEAPMIVNLATLVDVSLRLADVLESESALLREMKLKEIAPMQEEKIQLSRHVAMQQEQLKMHPEALDQADPTTLEQLMRITEQLQDVIAENLRLNTIARNVNQRVVKVISDALRDHQRPATYNRYGSQQSANNVTISVNLNQRA